MKTRFLLVILLFFNFFPSYSFATELLHIEITSYPNFSIVDDGHIDITGSVTSKGKILYVKINNNTATLEGDTFKLSDLPLDFGRNNLLIEVADLEGNKKSYIHTIYRQQPSSNNSRKSRVVFSSPYENQVITENALKIGGKFDQFDNIESISVNGQPCEVDEVNFTFTGPTLLSPGEARRRKVTSDSKEYIILKVDPITHSGKNILKVKITTPGDVYEDELTIYYYQLFIKEAFESERQSWFGCLETGFGRQIWNTNLFNEPPFLDWADMSCNIRVYGLSHNPEGWSYFNSDKLEGYLNPVPVWYFEAICASGYQDDVPIDIKRAETHLILHTPPAPEDKKLPLVLVFRGLHFVENIGPGYPSYGFLPVDLDRYIINDKPLKKLYGDFNFPSSNNAAYIILKDYEPDTDIELLTEIPSYRPGVIEYSSYLEEYFSFGDIKTLAADILVDSNNDGFLGGEDNSVEQLVPGCVFWVNNDDDSSESNVHPDDPDAANDEFNIDYEDDAINGIRDLEDFMPIDLTIPNIKDWRNTEGVKFYLKSEGKGGIRIVKRVDDTDEEGTKTYLVNLKKSIEQYKQKPLLHKKGNDNEIELTPDLFNQEGKFYGIFEGVEEGELKLTLFVELEKGPKKNRMVLDEAYITLKDVRDMYKLINVRNGSPNEEDYKIFSRNPDTILIWAHGYNNTLDGSIKSMDTVYKRLYRTGFRGGFIGISWPTHRWENDLFSTIDFNSDWVASYRSAPVVAEVISKVKEAYPNAKINLSAHSLGNNLFSHALRLLAIENDPFVYNFIMAEAAVPGEVYSGISRQKWYDMWGVRQDFFDNMYGRSLTAVKTKIYNTYSVTDDALNTAFRTNNFVLRLPTPLDDRYNLINYNVSTSGNVFVNPLGLSAASSSYINFVNDSKFYSKDTHPYGIRTHCSMTTEYLYDVMDFYEFLIDPETPSKTRR